MKCEAQLLIQAMNLLKPILARKTTTIPICQTLLLSASRNRLTLTANSLDEYQTEKIECEGDLSPCCVNFNHLLYSLFGEKVTIKEAKNNQVEIRCGGNEIYLATMDAEEFPKPPTEENPVKIGVACSELSDGINAVRWCARKDDAPRYALKSVHVVGVAKLLKCEASDSLQLAIYSKALIGGDFEIIVPADFATNFAEVLKRKGSEFTASNNCLKVIHDGGVYMCRQMDAKYPNTKAVIPEKLNLLGDVKMSNLIEVFSRCENYTVPAHTPIASLKFTSDGLDVTFKESTAELNLHVEGKFKAHTCNVNNGSFLKCLRGMRVETVKLFQAGTMTILDGGDIIVYSNNATPEFQKKTAERLEDSK